MFTGDRSTIARDEIGGFFHEGPPLAYSGLAQEIEIDSAMNATLSEVPVECRSVLVLFIELAQVSQIASDFFRRDCRVFPSFPCQGISRHECGCAQAGLA